MKKQVLFRKEHVKVNTGDYVECNEKIDDGDGWYYMRKHRGIVMSNNNVLTKHGIVLYRDISSWRVINEQKENA